LPADGGSRQRHHHYQDTVKNHQDFQTAIRLVPGQL